MSSPEKGPLNTIKAAAWTALLVAALLWSAVWLVSQIWIWLVVLAVVALIIWLLAWWARRDRW